MSNRLAIFCLCVTVLLVGPAAAAQADTATQLPFANGAWLTVDPAGQHVFVSGGPGNSSIVVLNYQGAIVKTITNQGGASQMALNSATHTLYVALHDATAISEINTQTLTETKRFSTAPYPDPSSLVIAGGKLWFSCFQGNGTSCPNLVSANLDGSGMAPAPAPISGWTFATALAAGGPGDKYLAVADSYQEPPYVAVYDVSGATPIQVSKVWNPNGDTAQVRDMTFDPSGANLLLAAGAPYYIESLATSNLLSSGTYPTGPYPISVAVTANGKFVAGGINTNMGPDVFVYPVDSTTPVRTAQVGDDDLSGLPHSLAFSPDASRLFAVVHDSASGHLAFHVLDKPTIALKATTTSMTRSARSVRYGAHASLKVHVNGTASGKVDLYATTTSAVKKLVATGALKSGVATFTVTPRQNTTYSAQFEQGSGYGSSTSPNVSIGVAPAMSVVTRPDGTGVLHGHRVSKTLLTARVRPARPNEPLGFLVQRQAGRHWRTVAGNQFPIEGGGTVHAFFLTNKPGLCRVRVVYSGDADYTRAKSAWKKFRAR